MIQIFSVLNLMKVEMSEECQVEYQEDKSDDHNRDGALVSLSERSGFDQN